MTATLPRRTGDRGLLVAWLRALDPSFDQGVYIVPSWQARGGKAVDLPDGYAAVNVVCGHVRKLLETLGTWRGPGFATIVSGPCLLLDFDRLLGIVMHEFAHFFDTQREAGPLIADIGLVAFHQAMSAPRRETEPATIPSYTRKELRTHHGPTFIRCCVHLAYRARRLGWRGNTAKVVNVPYYQFTREGESRFVSAAEFRAALGDEPYKLRALPMSEVTGISPPRRYRKFAAEIAEVEVV